VAAVTDPEAYRAWYAMARGPGASCRCSSERDLIDGARLADPARYSRDVVMVADMNLTFGKPLDGKGLDLSA
jgi:hypothetical protein